MSRYQTILTVRQKEVLMLIKKALAITGFPPTRAEIAAKLGFHSANAAEQHLRALEKKGIISLKSGISRGIQIIHESKKSYAAEDKKIKSSKILKITLPLIGSVAAGNPLQAIEHIQDEFQFDPSFFTENPDFLLRVKGMSMRDAGIIDGDLIAIKKQHEALDGDLVVARIEEEVTVKRFKRKGGRIELIAENPNFSDIILDPSIENFSIEGKVVGLIRNTIF